MARVRAKFALRDIDRGWQSLRREAGRIAEERGMYAKAGMLGAKAAEEHPDEGGGKGLTNVELLAVHEFGVPGHIPERSVVRASFDANRATYLAQLRALVGRWYDRAGRLPLRQALGIMGLKMVSDQRARVTQGSGIPPPNAPSTIARKLRKGAWKRQTPAQQQAAMAAGLGPRPLVDTGRMVGALTHEVVSGREDEE